MRADESNLQGPLTSSNDQVTFTLGGGHYHIATHATWGGGSATFEELGPDSTTWLTATTAFAADGVINVYLPPGQYRWTIATSTGFYGTVVRIPTD